MGSLLAISPTGSGSNENQKKEGGSPGRERREAGLESLCGLPLDRIVPPEWLQCVPLIDSSQLLRLLEELARAVMSGPNTWSKRFGDESRPPPPVTTASG